jgi:hypothetical protein
MDVIMDGLLIAATLFAGAYCWVLSRRVRALKSLDGGLGAAIVTLTRQIELARGTLDEARSGARETRQDLAQLTARADAASAQLRLLLAAVERRPIPTETEPPAPRTEAPAARRREPGGPRLVTGPGEEAPEAQEESPAAVPKPRRTLSLDGVLRRRAAAPEGAGEPDEAAVVAALTALAAGGER